MLLQHRCSIGLKVRVALLCDPTLVLDLQRLGLFFIDADNRLIPTITHSLRDVE